MNFNFNRNINESATDIAYKRLVDYYKRTRQFKKLKELVQSHNQNQGNQIHEDPQNEPENYDNPIEQEETNTIDVTPGNRDNTVVNKDNTFKAVDALNKNNNVPELFKNALERVASAHSKIIEMYESSLYEEDWNDVKINEFENLLEIYNTNLKYIKDNISSIEWKSEVIKKQFMHIYNDIIINDANSWNRIYARHNNYKRYRSNRKTIILQIADILGGAKNTNGKNYADIFKYFNNKCANIKLYDNSNIADKKDVLSFWLKPKLDEVMDDLKDLGVFGGLNSIDAVDIFKVFRLYVKCRKLAYAIFNLMTSNSEFNGYDRWHNKFIDYCDASLNDRQLEQLINAVGAEGQFEEVDDYQNIMDEQSWERKGIYESWFDESLDFYHAHKDRYNKSKISKINMIPTNANQCRVSCDGENVYANTTFYPGDIIEICPTKTVEKSSLYSRDMRDVVFEVVPNECWVIPFGYCRFYVNKNINECDINSGNSTYIWDPIKRVIVIKAINKIPKNEKIILRFGTQYE